MKNLFYGIFFDDKECKYYADYSLSVEDNTIRLTPLFKTKKMVRGYLIKNYQNRKMIDITPEWAK